MAYIWQTVEQAAVTLDISTRTIARRIAKGELESRLNSGRREVYICAPDFAASGVETIEGELTGSDAPQYHAEYEQTVRHTVAASSASGVDVETSTALILADPSLTLRLPPRGRRDRLPLLRTDVLPYVLPPLPR